MYDVNNGKFQLSCHLMKENQRIYSLVLEYEKKGCINAIPEELVDKMQEVDALLMSLGHPPAYNQVIEAIREHALSKAS